MASTHSLLLTPHFADSEATHLSVLLTLEAPHVKAGDILYYFETSSGNVPAHTYEPSAIHAADFAGPLPVVIVPPPPKGENGNCEEQWRAGRNTQGDITIKLEVRPRTVNAATPNGAHVDLRRDGSGLIGAGRWFLPRPWHPARKRYRFVLTWDLAEAPAGTRAVWSGGGEAAAPGQPVEVEGRADVFFSSVYMVGPIRSSPPFPAAAAATTTDGPCPNTTYWFGKLREDIDALKDFSGTLFPYAAAFFGTPPEDTYRVFIRKSIQGFGGTSCLGGYVLQYINDMEPWSDCRLVNLLAHEIVHNWAIMDSEDNGFHNSWYNEGIAQY